MATNIHTKAHEHLCPSCLGVAGGCSCEPSSDKKSEQSDPARAERVAAITTVVKLVLDVISDKAHYKIENSVISAENIMTALGLTPEEVKREALAAMDDWYQRVKEPVRNWPHPPPISAKDWAKHFRLASPSERDELLNSITRPVAPLTGSGTIPVPGTPQEEAKRLLELAEVGRVPYTRKEVDFLITVSQWRGQPTAKQLAWLKDLMLRAR